jgi:hypothetical protein
VAHIDLYCQRRVDPNTPIDDTVGAMAELVREGKTWPAAPWFTEAKSCTPPVSGWTTQSDWDAWLRTAVAGVIAKKRITIHET